MVYIKSQKDICLKHNLTYKKAWVCKKMNKGLGIHLTAKCVIEFHLKAGTPRTFKTRTHFSSFECAQPENCHPSGSHNHSARTAFRLRTHREPLSCVFPSTPGGQGKVLGVAGLWDGAGADLLSYTISHIRPSSLSPCCVSRFS